MKHGVQTHQSRICKLLYLLMGWSNLNLCGMHGFRIRNYIYVCHICSQWRKNWRILQKCGGVLKYLLQAFQIDAECLNLKTGFASAFHIKLEYIPGRGQ